MDYFLGLTSLAITIGVVGCAASVLSLIFIRIVMTLVEEVNTAVAGIETKLELLDGKLDEVRAFIASFSTGATSEQLQEILLRLNNVGSVADAVLAETEALDEAATSPAV
jgi:hypothetical protein